MAQTDEAPTRLHGIASALAEGCWLAVVILVPLVINPWGLSYELPKVAIFRGLTLLLLASHLLVLTASPTLTSPQRWLCRPLVSPILLVIGLVLLSTLMSLDPRLSLVGTYFRQQGTYLVLCLVLWALLVATHLRTSSQRRRLALAIIIAGTLVALTPFVESLRWRENPFTWRPGGSLGNPIFLGSYLIMAIPFTLAEAVSGFAQKAEDEQTRRRPALAKAMVCMALSLQVLALVITQSRGPWLGALAGLVLFATLVLWPTHRPLVIGGTIGGIIAGALLVGVLLAGLSFDVVPAESLSRLPYVSRVVAATDPSRGTIRVRIVLWKMAGGVVTDWPQVGLWPDPLRALRPMVGYGPDTGSVVYTAAYPPELAHIEDPGAFWDRAHNETLDVLTMRGWLGLAAWVVLGAACARRGLALWRVAGSPTERARVAAPLAALAAHVAELQFAFSITTTMMMGWLCVAWLAAPAASRAWDGGPEKEQGKNQGEQSHKDQKDHPRPTVLWRALGTAGALLALLLAARLEGGALWADTLVARARALDRAGQWKESIETYDRAIGIVPWQAAYHQFRAEAFYNLARALPDDEVAVKIDLFEAADRGLGRACELEPLEVEFYSNSGILHALWSEASGDPAHLETAASLFHQAFHLAPSLVRLRLNLAHIYHSHGRYQSALDQYQTVLEIDPQSTDAYYGTGLAWQALGRDDLAREAFLKALEVSPGCEVCAEAVGALEK
jgi:tetratricopeptide (TPR) repeat protein/O-antigen ligase